MQHKQILFPKKDDLRFQMYQAEWNKKDWKTSCCESLELLHLLSTSFNLVLWWIEVSLILYLRKWKWTSKWSQRLDAQHLHWHLSACRHWTPIGTLAFSGSSACEKSKFHFFAQKVPTKYYNQYVYIYIYIYQNTAFWILLVNWASDSKSSSPSAKVLELKPCSDVRLASRARTPGGHQVQIGQLWNKEPQKHNRVSVVKYVSRRWC